jgi:hypothetical protein
MFWMTKKNIKIRDLEFKVADLESEKTELKSDLARVTRIASDLVKRVEKAEINRSKSVSNIDLSSPLFQRIIKAGRNALIKKAHPDHGGSREELEEIQEAFEILRTVKLSYRSKQEEAARLQREAIYRHMAQRQNMNGSFWR